MPRDVSGPGGSDAVARPCCPRRRTTRRGRSTLVPPRPLTVEFAVAAARWPPWGVRWRARSLRRIQANVAPAPVLADVRRESASNCRMAPGWRKAKWIVGTGVAVAAAVAPPEDALADSATARYQLVPTCPISLTCQRISPRASKPSSFLIGMPMPSNAKLGDQDFIKTELGPIFGADGAGERPPDGVVRPQAPGDVRILAAHLGSAQRKHVRALGVGDCRLARRRRPRVPGSRVTLLNPTRS